MFENIRSRKRHGQAQVEYRACRKEVEEKLAALGLKSTPGNILHHREAENPELRRYLWKFCRGSGRIETVILLAGTLKAGQNLIPSFPNLFYFLGSPKKYRCSTEVSG